MFASAGVVTKIWPRGTNKSQETLKILVKQMRNKKRWENKMFEFKVGERRKRNERNYLVRALEIGI